ncbi:MAG: ankyrin repeat domain-containing protein [Verrucomicrobia bacterium]|nr:ankyrin repeat domain-containing protein [Cytophagales bacterium]
MPTFSMTFFSVCIYSLLSFGLAYVELAWLHKSFSVAGLWGGMVMIGLVNLTYLSLSALALNTYFFLFFFPLPIFPLIYILLKIGIYRLIKDSNNVPFSASLLLIILTVFSYFAASAFVMWCIKDINPTRANAEQAIRNKNKVIFETILWLAPFKGNDYMTGLVNEAIIYDNINAIKALIWHGADPETPYWIREIKSEEAKITVIKWQIDNGFLKENDYFDGKEYFDDYCLSSSSEELKYCISKGFKPKNTTEVIHKTILYHKFKNTKASPEEIKELREKIEILHKQGVSVTDTAYTLSFGSPVFAVISSGHELDPILAYLIEKGCPVNERVEQSINFGDGNIMTGITPLIVAVRFNRTSYVKMLLSKGADKFIKDNSGKTATDYSSDTGIHEAIRHELSIKH